VADENFYMGYPPRKLRVYLFSYFGPWPLICKLNQEGDVLALRGRNSLPMTHTSVLFVAFIKENDKKLPSGSQKTRVVKELRGILHMSQAITFQRYGRTQALLR
jgi:hypothetical protein